MDTHLSHAHCSVTEQFKTSSHQLEIEIGKYANKPMEVNFHRIEVFPFLFLLNPMIIWIYVAPPNLQNKGV